MDESAEFSPLAAAAAAVSYEYFDDVSSGEGRRRRSLNFSGQRHRVVVVDGWLEDQWRRDAVAAAAAAGIYDDGSAGVEREESWDESLVREAVELNPWGRF